jgi:Protein of unknown function (DUF3311)
MKARTRRLREKVASSGFCRWDHLGRLCDRPRNSPTVAHLGEGGPMSTGVDSSYGFKEAVSDQHDQKRAGWSWWYLLFLIQFIAVLWPPFYNTAEPALIGLPFFYWYQLLWIILGAVMTAIVYFVTDE